MINGMEDKITLIIKRVQKLMMKDKFSRKTYNRRSNYKKEGPSREEKEKREGSREVICYKFKKLGDVNMIVLFRKTREKREEP